VAGLVSALLPESGIWIPSWSPAEARAYRRSLDSKQGMHKSCPPKWRMRVSMTVSPHDSHTMGARIRAMFGTGSAGVLISKRSVSSESMIRFEIAARVFCSRSDLFIILRFGVHYSIFNLRSFRYGESNSFDEAMSARQAFCFSR
jgi:hypothetical protein